MTLDQNHPTTKKHIPIVIGPVRNQLTNYAHSNPSKEVKKLLMLLQGLAVPAS